MQPTCPLCDGPMKELTNSAYDFQCPPCHLFHRPQYTRTLRLGVRVQTQPVILQHFATTAMLVWATDIADAIDRDVGATPGGILELPCEQVRDALSPEWWERILKLKVFL